MSPHRNTIKSFLSALRLWLSAIAVCIGTVAIGVAASSNRGAGQQPASQASSIAGTTSSTDASAPPANCTKDGLIVVTDPTGDQAPGGSSKQDIQSISIAEPSILYTDNPTAERPVIIMKVVELNEPVPKNLQWKVYFTAPNGNTYFMSMETDAANQAYFPVERASVYFGTSTNGVDTIKIWLFYGQRGYYTSDGRIVFVLPTDFFDFGDLSPGHMLKDVHGTTATLLGTRGQPGPPNVHPDPPSIPIDSTDKADYALVGNASCSAYPPPPVPAPRPTPGPSVPCVPIAGVDDKCEAWVTTYDHPGGQDGFEFPTAIATNPAGNLVYVAAYSFTQFWNDGAPRVHAYESATGKEVWTAPIAGNATITDLVVSPDGKRVYATGWGNGPSAYVTVAFDASTGQQLWLDKYRDAHSVRSLAHKIAMSPDGKRIFVTGQMTISYKSDFSDWNENYVTVAYDADSGNRLWTAQYDATFEAARYIKVSPRGDVVYVTGDSYSKGLGGYLWSDYATVAYDAATGRQLWVARFDGVGRDDTTSGLEVSPDGSKIYVAGTSDQSTDVTSKHLVYATVAYDAATGSQLWLKYYDGPAATDPQGEALALGISPIGDRIYVTGEIAEDATPGVDAATVAYDAVTGAEVWVARFGQPQNPEIGRDVKVSPDGTRVYITGNAFNPTETGSDFLTISYDAGTGSQQWIGRYNSSPANIDQGAATHLALSPDGARAFVTGFFDRIVYGTPERPVAEDDIFTAAYDTGIPPLKAVVSRKVHGSAGTFDIDLPLAGSRGIECRSGGANRDYTMIFKFANTLTSVGGASVTGGTGTVSSSATDSSDAHNYIVDLTGVTNAQTITVSLSNVNDSAGNSSASVSASMGVLIGDTNADGVVNSGDIAQTKSQSGQSVTNSDFREDLNTDGALNSADISLVKSKSGTGLP